MIIYKFIQTNSTHFQFVIDSGFLFNSMNIHEVLFYLCTQSETVMIKVTDDNWKELITFHHR